MDQKNTIKSILILPYSPVTCQYVINNSQDTHATTYDKITEMLSSIAPQFIYTIDSYMSRRLSFYIDLENKTIQEVQPDEQLIIEQNRKEKLSMNQNSINSFLKQKVDKSMGNSVYLNVVNKLWRKNEHK